MELINDTVPWSEVYHKIAIELRQFYKKNGNLSGQELFKILWKSKFYRDNNTWLSNVSQTIYPSVDPIQLFVSFSRSKQKGENRVRIINKVWSLLTQRRHPEWKNINFEGCPAPVAIKLQYVRTDSMQIDIWNVFNDVMEKGKDALNREVWDNVKVWRGIEIPSFTIFLFWINSSEFLPLDSNTRQYLIHRGLIATNASLSVNSYLSLLVNNEIENYTLLATEAYYFVNFPDLYSSKFDKRSSVRTMELKRSAMFRFVGIRTLGKSKNIHKVLLPYQYYSIDHTLKPEDHTQSASVDIQKFVQQPTEVETLYRVENLWVNISAIVGKNGSGKSSLLDLVLMGIYNFSLQQEYIDVSKNKPLKHLNFEMYWLSDTLYKMVFNEGITIYRFNHQNSGKNNSITYQLITNPISVNDIAGSFFYTILVNFSHYALNSNDYSTDWITPLSHKNDGYLTPLVINPQRTYGNINVNTERSLLNMRLLLNLLELHDANIPDQSFRVLDDKKRIDYFSVSLNREKINSIKKFVREKIYNNDKILSIILTAAIKTFKLDEDRILPDVYSDGCKYYIAYKVFTIIDRYSYYIGRYKHLNRSIKLAFLAPSEDIKNKQEDETEFVRIITKFFIDIKNDRSHITSKLKQAIFYLKYHELQSIITTSIQYKPSSILLDDYNKIATNILNTVTEEIDSMAEILPPPIFKLDFHLNDKDKSSFSKASSGEYQIVSVLSNILYHIRNIDSIKEEENKYNYVTVLLDEIELYFHPNMQRSFIKRLLDSLSKLDSDLYGIHILLATHSPFILSDLQQQKILKLKKGAVEIFENSYNSFAANIHDLLADEFFMSEGYMGAFAKQKIETTINILNYLIASKKGIKEEISFYYNNLEVIKYWEGKPEGWNVESEKDNIFQIIEIIGEPIIKEKLSSMYRAAFRNDINNETTRIKAKNDILQMMRENNLNPEDF